MTESIHPRDPDRLLDAMRKAAAELFRCDPDAARATLRDAINAAAEVGEEIATARVKVFNDGSQAISMGRGTEAKPDEATWSVWAPKGGPDAPRDEIADPRNWSDCEAAAFVNSLPASSRRYSRPA